MLKKILYGAVCLLMLVGGTSVLADEVQNPYGNKVDQGNLPDTVSMSLDKLSDGDLAQNDAVEADSASTSTTKPLVGPTPREPGFPANNGDETFNGRTLNNSHINIYNPKAIDTWLSPDYQARWDFSQAKQVGYIVTSPGGASGDLDGSEHLVSDSGSQDDFVFNIKNIPNKASDNWGTTYNTNYGFKVINLLYNGQLLDMDVNVHRLVVQNMAKDTTSATLNSVSTNVGLGLVHWQGVYALRFYETSNIVAMDYTISFYKAGTTTPVNVKNSFIYGDQEGVVTGQANQQWVFPDGTTKGNLTKANGDAQLGEQFKVQNASDVNGGTPAKGSDGAWAYPQFSMWANNAKTYTATGFIPDLNLDAKYYDATAIYNENQTAADSTGLKAQKGALRILKGYDYVKNGSVAFGSPNVNEMLPRYAQWSFLFNGSKTQEQEHSAGGIGQYVRQGKPIPASYYANGAHSLGGYHNFLAFSSILPSKVTPPKKYVSDRDEQLVKADTLDDAHETYNYTLEGYFPVQYYQDLAMKSWKMEDTLPPGISLNTAIANITAYFTDGTGANLGDAKDYFDYSYDSSSRKLTITAKSTTLNDLDMYSIHSDFRFNIPVRITDESKLTKDDAGKVLITNNATQSGTYFSDMAFSDKTNDVTTTYKTNSLEVHKSVDKSIAETGTIDPLDTTKGLALQPITYTVDVTNGGDSTTMDEVKVLDVLPYANDIRKTIFNPDGTSHIMAISLVDDAGQAVPNSKLFVNTDSSYDWGDLSYNPNSLSSDDTAMAKLNWVRYTGGSISSDVEQAKAIYAYIPNLPAKTTYHLKVTVRHQDNIGADLFNNAKVNSVVNEVKTSETVETKIYGRALSGTVWSDNDADGLKGDNEQGIANIPVKLYRTSLLDANKRVQVTSDMDGKAFVDASGKSLVLTDKDGHYTFNKLPEGEYSAAFEFDDKAYMVTKKLVDSVASDAINSKVDPKGKAISDNPLAGSSWSRTGDLLANLPALTASSQGLETMPYNNLGLIPQAELQVLKYQAGSLIDQDGDGKYSVAELAAAKAISGAKFQLYKGKLDSIPTDGMANSAYIGEYTTDAKGMIDTKDGLYPVNDYTLFEVASPTGYELYKKPIHFTITSSGQLITLQVSDEVSTELPSAGSTGSNQLLLGGIIVVLLGLGLLIASLYVYYKRGKKPQPW